MKHSKPGRHIALPLRVSLIAGLLITAILPVMAAVDWKALDVGNLSSAVYNTAVVGHPSNPTANPSGWWPAGTNDSYIYEGDIWMVPRKVERLVSLHQMAGQARFGPPTMCLKSFQTSPV